jgi:hypothetical protein
MQCQFSLRWGLESSFLSQTIQNQAQSPFLNPLRRAKGLRDDPESLRWHFKLYFQLKVAAYYLDFLFSFPLSFPQPKGILYSLIKKEINSYPNLIIQLAWKWISMNKIVTRGKGKDSLLAKISV